LIVPSSDWLTPLPAWAVPVKGGHAAAHAPVHMDMPFLSASNRYRARPPLPTSAWPGIPERVASDTAAPLLAWLLAAGLLAWLVAAGLLAWVAADDAGLAALVLDPLEQAANIRPIPAPHTALTIRYLMLMLLVTTRPGSDRGRLCRIGGPRPGQVLVPTTEYAPSLAPVQKHPAGPDHRYRKRGGGYRLRSLRHDLPLL
jgi:hypothetical protein